MTKPDMFVRKIKDFNRNEVYLETIKVKDYKYFSLYNIYKIENGKRRFLYRRCFHKDLFNRNGKYRWTKYD